MPILMKEHAITRMIKEDKQVKKERNQDRNEGNNGRNEYLSYLYKITKIMIFFECVMSQNIFDIPDPAASEKREKR